MSENRKKCRQRGSNFGTNFGNFEKTPSLKGARSLNWMVPETGIERARPGLRPTQKQQVRLSSSSRTLNEPLLFADRNGAGNRNRTGPPRAATYAKAAGSSFKQLQDFKRTTFIC